jgi:hypothetical protein
MCKPAELEPGAYVSDPSTSRLFEVQDADKRQVHLIDVRSPIDDPTVIGMLTDNALRRLELVRPAPCLADTASEAGYGAMGTAPE